MIQLKPSQTIRILCTILQEPNSARFADIIHTNNEYVEKFFYELTQKLTHYRDFLFKLTPLIEHNKIFEDSHH